MLIYTTAMLLIPYADANGAVYHGLWLNGNNLSAWIDHSILGANHVYSKSLPFNSDPEGILTTLPAISTCLSGVLVGIYLQQARNNSIDLAKQVAFLSIIGIIGVVLGQLMHNWLPINKALWTPSYVILTSGFACIALAVCIYLVEIKKFRRWSAPFLVFGVNSIAFFMFSGIIGRLLMMIQYQDMAIKTWLYQSIYLPTFGPLNGSLAFALSFLIISYLVMHWMYRNNIIWKV